MRLLKVFIVLGVLALLIMAAAPFGAELIEIAGKNLPKQHLSTDYAWGLAWSVVLALTIALWPLPWHLRRNLLWLWAAKVVTSLGLMLAYEWNYGLDAYAYFWFGQPGLYQDAPVLGDGTSLVTWLSHLHWRYLIADSYHAMKLSFGYVGLVGSYLFYRAATIAFGRDDVRLLWLVVCLPSVLMWSTILGKDPIVFFGIGLYCYGVARFARGMSSVPSLALAALGIACTAAFRPWLAPVLIAPLFSFLWQAMRRPFSRAVLAVLVISGFFAVLEIFSERLKVASVDDAVAHTEIIAKNFAQGGSANRSELGEQNSLERMLLFAPVGAFTALFRPLPGEVLNLFGTIAGLENAAIFLLALVALRRVRLRSFAEPLVMWAASLVLVWSFVYGFVSYHNAGTAVRYRLQIIAVFVCLLLYLVQRRERGDAR